MIESPATSKFARPRSVHAALVAALALGACAPALAQDPHAGHKMPMTMPVDASSAVAPVTADVVGSDGKSLGTVTLTDTPTGVLVRTDLKGLPTGDHGFHFHAVGKCEPAAKFETAGGHFAGASKVHGLMSAGGPHGGDMPNQHVGADGKLVTQIFATGATLRAGAASLVDADGAALVIHANPDDYTSQPAGNAGPRIACAVIAAPR